MCPPSRRDRLDEEALAKAMSAWLDVVAQELRVIHAQAKGGVLVLNTSYEAVEGLRQRLQATGQVDGVDGLPHLLLVFAREGRGVMAQAKEFLQLQDAGGKPLWLAVGSAWTGLDVGGHEPREALLGKDPLPAELDNVMTDLVVTRMPFGANNSITHLRRVLMRPSIPWDMLDAAFRFRQALGRLVRRRGLPQNRQIWLLDGRLGEPDSAARLSVFWAPINRIREHISRRQSAQSAA